MEIKKIKIENFKGFEGEHIYALPKIVAFNAKNGYGKTSFIDAFRFALTGRRPDGDLINKKANTASVTIELEGGEQFTRIEERGGKANKFKQNGRNCTKARLDDALSTWFETDVSALQITSCAELLGSLTSAELGDLIMRYTPSQFTTEDVMGYVSNITPEMKTLIEERLPKTEFGVDAVDRFYQEVFLERRETNAELKVKNNMLSGMPDVKPLRSKEEIETDMKAISELVKTQAAYKAEKAAYDRAVAAKVQKENSLKDLAEQGKKLKMEKPDVQNRAVFVQEKETAGKAKDDALKVLASMQNSKAQLEVALNNLMKPYCPLSDKLTCTVDKSALKSDFERSIRELEAGIKTQQEAVHAWELKVKAIEAKIVEYDDLKNRWNQYALVVNNYLAQKKELDAMLKNMPAEPKPVDVPADTEAKLSRLNRELAGIDKWNEREKLAAEVVKLKTESGIYEHLVKSFEPKGEVKRGLLDYYRSIVEDFCNEEANRLKPGMRMKFIAENGMQVFCDTGNGKFLDYRSLSGGEQVYMIYILMKLLNNLSMSRILIMDELSVLDADNFKQLVKLISDDKDDYDIVILATTGDKEADSVLINAGIQPFSL